MGTPMGATRTTTTGLDELRARIAATPRNNQGHRQYSRALKESVRRYARDRLRAGAGPQNAVARELGISSDTLWSWVNGKGRAAVRSTAAGAAVHNGGLPAGARKFRAVLAALGPRGRTTPYPRELRREAVAYLRERRAAGASQRAIAGELGLGHGVLRNWRDEDASSIEPEAKGTEQESDRARRFRAAVAQLGPRGQRTPYPAALRAEALAYMKERRSAGTSLVAIARDLGVGAGSLCVWSGMRSRGVTAVRRVAVEERSGPCAAGVHAGIVIMHGATGLRIEGMDVSTVVDLLKALS